VDIGAGKDKKKVPYVRVPAQIGLWPDRQTYYHVNVIADKNFGVDMIRETLEESLETRQSLWNAKTIPGHYRIQTQRPE
jgi:hypothetical protein